MNQFLILIKKYWPHALGSLVLVLTIVYPHLELVRESLQRDGSWTFENYTSFFSGSAPYLKALWGSVWLSVASALLAALIGVPMAFLFELFEIPAKRFLATVATLPIVLPPLVGVVAFLFLLGESGMLPRSIQVLFQLEAPPFYLEGVGAVLAVHAYSFYVYFFLFVRAAFKRLDGATIEAAKSLGANAWTILWSVLLPQLRPAIVAAAILVFMISMASFSAPFIFAGDFRVLTVEIYNSKLRGDMPMAITQSVMLAVISMVFMAFSLRGERSLAGGSQKGAPIQPRPIKTPMMKWLANVLAVLASLVVALPHLTLLLLSFVKNGSWTTQILPDTFTSANYVGLFNDPQVAEPVINSTQMALLATIGNVALAILFAYWNTQRPWRLKRLSEIIIMLPWAIPGTVVAIALIVAFNQPHWFTGNAILVGSFWILPLAYFIRHLPVVYRAGHAAMIRFEKSQEEAARSLGAGTWLTFRRVIFPSVRPGLIAGALLATVMSLGEFVSSILLYSFSNRPISIAILNEIRLLNLGSAAAYGVFLTILIFGITWLSNKWGEL